MGGTRSITEVLATSARTEAARARYDGDPVRAGKERGLSRLARKPRLKTGAFAFCFFCYA